MLTLLRLDANYIKVEKSAFGAFLSKGRSLWALWFAVVGQVVFNWHESTFSIYPSCVCFLLLWWWFTKTLILSFFLQRIVAQQSISLLLAAQLVPVTFGDKFPVSQRITKFHGCFPIRIFFCLFVCFFRFPAFNTLTRPLSASAFTAGWPEEADRVADRQGLHGAGQRDS